MNPEWLGFVAATLTTTAYVPQVIKVARQRCTKSISLGMYAMLTLGIFLWCIYGYLIGSPSILYANGLCTVMAGYILWMKLKHG